MKINFQQGIITYPASGPIQNFLTRTGNYVSLSTVNGPVDISFAFGTSNYLFTESTDRANAWGPIPNGINAWLYWDLNLRTGVRTFGYTTIAPSFGNAFPASPLPDTHFFRLDQKKMYVYQSNNWRAVARVFAAKFNTNIFTGLGSNFPGRPFSGTQVGIFGQSVETGRIIVDDTGNPIRRSTGEFFTTTSNFFVNGSPVNTIRLEANVISVTALENLGEFHVVKLTQFGRVQLAGYADTQEYPIGMMMEGLNVNETGTMIVQGTVTNPSWNWATPGVHLWINVSGQLTDVDPYVVDNVTYPVKKPPVGAVLTPTTIIFDQGLGGIGERGLPGQDIGAAPASVTTLGVSKLSVAAANPLQPVVVGDNDPRNTDARVPLPHVQPATTIVFTPFGGLTNTNAQTVLEQVETNKVDIAGDTMTGFLTLHAAPVLNFHASTKQYVDASIAAIPVVPIIDKLDDLSDVVITTPTANREILFNNGVMFVNKEQIPYGERQLPGNSYSITSDIFTLLNTTSSANYNVTGPGTLSFNYAYDTLPADEFSVLIDGVPNLTVSGTSGTTNLIPQTFSIPGGAHIIRFQYQKLGLPDNVSTFDNFIAGGTTEDLTDRFLPFPIFPQTRFWNNLRFSGSQLFQIGTNVYSTTRIYGPDGTGTSIPLSVISPALFGTNLTPAGITDEFFFSARRIGGYPASGYFQSVPLIDGTLSGVGDQYTIEFDVTPIVSSTLGTGFTNTNVYIDFNCDPEPSINGVPAFVTSQHGIQVDIEMTSTGGTYTIFSYLDFTQYGFTTTSVPYVAGTTYSIKGIAKHTVTGVVYELYINNVLILSAPAGIITGLTGTQVGIGYSVNHDDTNGPNGTSCSVYIDNYKVSTPGVNNSEDQVLVRNLVFTGTTPGLVQGAVTQAIVTGGPGTIDTIGSEFVEMRYGNNSTRPLAPVLGMLRLNTENLGINQEFWEYWEGTQWKQIGGNIAFNDLTDVDVTPSNDNPWITYEAGQWVSKVGQPYDVHFYLPASAASVPEDVMGLMIMSREVWFNINFQSSTAFATVAPNANVVFEVRKNNSVVLATVTFPNGFTTGTVAQVCVEQELICSAGDRVSIHPIAPANTSIQDVAVVLVGCTTRLLCPTPFPSFA